MNFKSQIKCGAARWVHMIGAYARYIPVRYYMPRKTKPAQKPIRPQWDNSPPPGGVHGQ